MLEIKCVTKKTGTLAQPQLTPSSWDNMPAHMSLKTIEFMTNNMVIVPHPPYLPDLVPVISLCFPNLKWNWWDDVLKQCLTSKGNRKRYSTALRKTTSTVLLKSEKAMELLYTFPRRLFWRRWQPILSKFRQNVFFDLVREISDSNSYTTTIMICCQMKKTRGVVFLWNLF
jgi:hypothetical protein